METDTPSRSPPLVHDPSHASRGSTSTVRSTFSSALSSDSSTAALIPSPSASDSGAAAVVTAVACTSASPSADETGEAAHPQTTPQPVHDAPIVLDSARADALRLLRLNYGYMMLSCPLWYLLSLQLSQPPYGPGWIPRIVFVLVLKGIFGASFAWPQATVFSDPLWSGRLVNAMYTTLAVMEFGIAAGGGLCEVTTLTSLFAVLSCGMCFSSSSALKLYLMLVISLSFVVAASAAGRPTVSPLAPTLFVLNMLMASGRLHIVATRMAILEHTQRELAAAKRRADEANQVKTEFLARMSHEMRTPLHAVIGYASIMAEGGLPKPERREALDSIRLAAAHLLNLVNDLLDLHRIERGKLALESAVFALRRCIAESITHLAWNMRQKGIQFDAEVDPSVPDLRRGDPKRLGQVLINLLTNSLKFTDSGSIRVGVRPVPPDDNVLLFEVRDTGCGIPRSAQHRLFQDFEQVHTAEGAERQGAGLGLSICRQIVEAMGGRIWVTSEPGRGSTFAFTVRLPVEAPVAPAPPESPVQPPQRRPLRVLLADDDEQTRSLMVRLLRVDGHRVTVARNGQEALEQLAALGSELDVALIDMDMPRYDGMHVVRTYRFLERQRPAARHLPMVAFTANVMSGDRERYYAAGFDAMLAKPADIAAVRAVLASIGSCPVSGSLASDLADLDSTRSRSAATSRTVSPLESGATLAPSPSPPPPPSFASAPLSCPPPPAPPPPAVESLPVAAAHPARPATPPAAIPATQHAHRGSVASAGSGPTGSLDLSPLETAVAPASRESLPNPKPRLGQGSPWTPSDAAEGRSETAVRTAATDSVRGWGLPLAGTDSATACSGAGCDRSGGCEPRLRVLYADDNGTNRRVLTHMLQRLGADVVVVEDGRRAIDLCAQNSRFDLVILDSRMPGLSGHDTARHIRSHWRRHGLPAVPIVLLTADACAGEHCLQGVMDMCLHKPLCIEVLRDVLRRRVPRFVDSSERGDG